MGLTLDEILIKMAQEDAHALSCLSANLPYIIMRSRLQTDKKENRSDYFFTKSYEIRILK